ncbi:MAG: glycerophosphodiester phosphodiesterase [bacterium]|uniref:Glycerophosphodiester phosphodiesterase n=1 Tax=Candidatus Methylomirabilis tolerans TaxID=3123416 RepID=A0AAJ1AJ27_9BACT|nr:glycerophosphodiester phosphodiesterase [Candidatus Methylomirabilis sp.]
MTLNIAHRGASAQAPENTMAAFEKAVELGADAIELDLHVSRDGELVVIHDVTLDRTTDGRGPVHTHSLQELKQLDAGRWFGESFAGQRIPTLAEVLDRFAGKVPLALEVKAGSAFFPGIEERVVSALREHQVLSQVAVASFDHHALFRLKELEPCLRTAALLVGRPMSMSAVAGPSKVDAMALECSLVTKTEIDACRASGLQLVVWVVNEPAQMRHFIDLGIDGIITDRPDLLRHALT